MHRAKDIEKIIEGFKLIRQHFRSSSNHKADLALTHSQWLALAVISRSDFVTVGDVRNALGISSSASTQLANNLEKKGYIKREIHISDGRVSVLVLTTKTKKIFSTLRAKKIKEFSKLFNIFNDEEFILYLKLHTKLIKSIS